MKATQPNELIRLHDVGMRWDRRQVLSDVNLTLYRGDFMAITGPNGGGKTTLLRIVLRLLRPTHGSVTYFCDGTEVNKLPIGYLPQKNMIDSKFPITVREVVASGLLADRKLPAQEKSEAVRRMIELVGLERHTDASVGQLSGGQLQRALLGRALISSPQVLVLDEPLSYVDKKFEHHIYEIIASIAGNTTIMLVSHEMSTIAAMANRHIIVDGSVHQCHSGSHLVHYDCDCEASEPSFLIRK